jgi:hypothetical protein
MVLYVSVVEIAELTAIPEDHFAHGRVTGPTGQALLGIIWGTAVGLALAHWFAFGLAARGFRGERVTRTDTYVGLAQVGAAMFVAALSSVPILFLPDVREQETTAWVPALLIGVVAYLISRRSGSKRLAAVLYGIVAVALGIAVALVKSKLAAH